MTMLGFAWFLALVLTPAREPTPPPEIIEVRSTYLCTLLHENAAPAFAALAQNETEIDAGRKGLAALGRDQFLRGLQGSQQMDLLRIENHILPIVRNLEAIDVLLADPKRFVATPQSDDEREAARLKKQLVAIEQQQKDALNVLNGTVESADLADMMQLPDMAIGTVAGAASGDLQTKVPPTGTKMGPDVRALAGQTLTASAPATFLAAGVGRSQVAMDALGRDAAATIARIAEGCKPSPAP